MDRKFIIAVVVVFIVTSVLGFITHGWALADEYNATGLMRSIEDQEAQIGWMMLAHAIIAYALVWIYRRGREDKPWMAQGARFGFMIALLMVVPIFLIYYSVQPLPGMLVFRQISYDTINMMITGVVIAYLYR